MNGLLVMLLTAAALSYVTAPLLRREAAPCRLLLPEPSEALVAEGITYSGEDEWAIDRALGKAGHGEPMRRVESTQQDLDAEIERRVAALRAERREARTRSRRIVCSACGKAFQAGDRFCARCGEPHPSVCPQCGERHHPDDCFCTRCGAPLQEGRL